MPALRTEITEIVTGLATLGFADIETALAATPAELVNVGASTWQRLEGAYAAGEYPGEFAGAWSNGLAFLKADFGLRGRVPLRVEWKGPHRPPGYELIPADLRIDHVYLVSCKYRSKILLNAGPAHLFDRVLAERYGSSIDWYLEVAPVEFQDLYQIVRNQLSSIRLPGRVSELSSGEKGLIASSLGGGWPKSCANAYTSFCTAVGQRSAERWLRQLTTLGHKERMLWRLLRLSGAPYFVLGASSSSTIRLRMCTPWDWRQKYSLRAFHVWGDPLAGQPVVRWKAEVEEKGEGLRDVEGHIQVRWSHGRFGGRPEAKVYLDIPHEVVPGYEPL